MKWTEDKIKEEILGLAKKLNINRMPTNTEMIENKQSGLSRAITLNGGIIRWAELTDLPMKKRKSKWTDELIVKEIHKSINTLCITRMPTTSELLGIGRGDLQNVISKNGGFRYWANKVGLKLKNSETTKGQKYERIATDILNKQKFNVEVMSNGHPYDLLIDGNVKVDVKVGAAHYHFGSRAHTFRPSSKNSTCDIYVCFALDENEETENIFIIPSKFAKVQTINVGTNSKYDRFIDRWDFVNEYTKFYDSVVM